MKRAVGIVLILAAALASWTFGQAKLESGRLARRATMFRDSLSLLRRDAEMCQAGVNHEAASFQDLVVGVDSMRTDVESFEEEIPEGRGVRGDQYAEYMEAFDDYNEAVRLWGERAEGLEAQAVVCRGLFVQHNQIVDTLRVLAERLGER